MKAFYGFLSVTILVIGLVAVVFLTQQKPNNDNGTLSEVNTPELPNIEISSTTNHPPSVERVTVPVADGFKDAAEGVEESFEDMADSVKDATNPSVTVEGTVRTEPANP